MQAASWARGGSIWLLLSAVGALALSGCPDDPPTVGRLVQYEPPPPPDLSPLGLPTDPEGRPVLISGPGLALAYDAEAKDPVTALASCTRWVMSCLDPNSRSLDDCFYSAPRCATQEPWRESAECCPQACFDAYAVARVERALEPYPAFEAVMFRDGSCVPELRPFTGRSAP